MITESDVRELVENGLRFMQPQAVDVTQLEVQLEPGNALDDTTRWHQIALEGEWDGHWQGAFKLDERDFEQMLLHFRSLKNDTVVDYEHNSLNWFVQQSPAAGWISDLDVRETDQGLALFARVQWTKKAAEMIRAGEYRYLSPTILWRTRDRKTGADLGSSIHSVALTNTPFLDELPEVRLNSIMRACRAGANDEGDRTMNTEQKAAINAVLGLGASAGFEEAIAEIRQLQADAKGVERIAHALGIEGGSIDALVVSATALSDEVNNLRVKAARADTLEGEILVRQARDEGKITADNAEFVAKLAKENPAMFSEWLKTAPKVVPNKPIARTAAGAKLPEGEEKTAAALAAMTEEDYRSAKSWGLTPQQYAKRNADDILGAA